MSFIQRELEKIEIAMRGPVSPSAYSQLYAQSQALSWALEPNGYATPSEVVLNSRIQTIKGIPANSINCQE
jgi:hypothetical protein